MRTPRTGLLCLVSLPLVVLAALDLGGCAGSLASAPGLDADAARRAFDEAQEAFENGNYLEATTGFNVVRTRYPYSQYAAEAELRLADCDYAQDKFAEATEGYRAFIRSHPNHPKVAYAAFRIGKAYYEQIPGDWLVTPPPYEKDQAATRDALRELRSFVGRFPDAPERAEAEAMAAECEHRLAEHEMYVARFYLERDRPRAAIARLRGLAETYPDSRLAPDALLEAGRLHLRLGEREEAARVLQDLVRRYPRHPGAGPASDMLRELAVGR